MSDDEKKPADPKWVVAPAMHGSILVHDDAAPEQFCVGGFTCSDCHKGHVVFAMFVGRMQLEVTVDPETGREIATSILAAVERAGGAGKAN